MYSTLHNLKTRTTMTHTHRYLSLAACAFALTLAGCDAVVATSPADASTAITSTTATTATESIRLGKAEANQVAAARRATARYHDVDEAFADGWAAVVSECVAVPGLGGMGYHHLNPSLADGTVDASAPEILLYAPQKNGRLRLVGVEYVVPFGVMPRAADGGTAPELFGEQFSESEAAGGWALHAWIWRHNPAGLFADFNPMVSCENA